MTMIIANNREELQKIVRQDLGELEPIKQLWVAHSTAEKNRNISGLINTLTPDCEYRVAGYDKVWKGHSEAEEFYFGLLGAIDEVDFKAYAAKITPECLSEKAMVTGIFLQPWMNLKPTGGPVEFEVEIDFPYDKKTGLFKGENVRLPNIEQYLEKYQIKSK